jgi:hypothetical protein
MPVLTWTLLSLLGAGLFAALSAALYSALPRNLLESAEQHGRFRGLEDQDELVKVSGTPSEASPRGALSGQTA